MHMRKSNVKGSSMADKQGSKVPRSGFTLIEVILVIGILAVLGAVIFINLNPAHQFSKANNTKRWSAVNSILNAVGQRTADNRGVFQTGCAAGVIPVSATQMGSGAGNYNIEPCLVPAYLPSMPLDPVGGTSAATGYRIQRDATTGRVTVTAPNAELGEAITQTR